MNNGDPKGLHTLKTESEYFEPILSRKKNFELRLNDRDFQVGDILRLEEVKDGRFTGRNTYRIVSYVLKEVPNFGLKEGHAILGMF